MPIKSEFLDFSWIRVPTDRLKQHHWLPRLDSTTLDMPTLENYYRMCAIHVVVFTVVALNMIERGSCEEPAKIDAIVTGKLFILSDVGKKIEDRLVPAKDGAVVFVPRNLGANIGAHLDSLPSRSVLAKIATLGNFSAPLAPGEYICLVVSLGEANADKPPFPIYGRSDLTVNPGGDGTTIKIVYNPETHTTSLTLPTKK